MKYSIKCTDCGKYMGILHYEAVCSCAECHKKNMQLEYDNQHRSPDVQPDENSKV